MLAWLPLALFGLFMGALMIGISLYQAACYQRYLSQHISITQEMMREQKRAQVAISKQTAALERIAVA